MIEALSSARYSCMMLLYLLMGPDIQGKAHRGVLDAGDYPQVVDRWIWPKREWVLLAENVLCHHTD